jgi:membrane protease YdiL (CAAX protease family)
MPISQPKKRRVWAALIGAPFVLGLTFFPVVGYVASTQKLEGDALMQAIEPIGVYPASVGFALVLALTRWLAARDGVALGWSRPSPADLAIGLGLGATLATLDAKWLFPAIGFDATLPGVPLAAAVGGLAIASAAEDTLYRGYALTVLKARHGLPVAIAVTTLFYVFIAPPRSVALLAWAVGFGVMLCGVRLWRGNLWPVVLTHALVATGPKLWAAVWVFASSGAPAVLRST